MDVVQYQRVSVTGETQCAAFLDVGRIGFSGQGSTYAEAHAELLRQLEMHRATAERAVEDARNSQPPVDSPAAE